MARIDYNHERKLCFLNMAVVISVHGIHRREMMTVLKFIRIGLVALIALLLILVIALLIHHQYQLRKEAKAYPAPGSLVQVNGHLLHVYAQGEGPQTLVFMAGHGTSNPLLDFKPLWSRLSESYRVVIVEKSGYGWSPVSRSSRSLDTMLEETRQALQLAGETGPYVLVPHSMSGLEAIYWAQKYPGEVVAITALDPAVPGTVAAMPEPPQGQLYSMYVISRLGLSRFMPDEDAAQSLPLLKTAELSEDDRSTYMAIFYKSAFTRDMLREAAALSDNAAMVAQAGVPVQVPIHFFISSDQMIADADWQQLLIDYLEPVESSGYTLLDTGHYVHYEKSEEIAAEIVAFIEGLPK